MAISADMVKKLREQTGAGMMDCKKALTETGGDFDKAVTLLREKGIAVAAKREAKAASEGMIGSYISDDMQTGVLVEVNCETTFVAKTDEFINLAKTLAEQAAKQGCGTVECILSKPDPDNTNQTLQDRVNEIMGKVGEKTSVARLAKLDVSGTGVIGSYIHMGDQIGVLVELNCQSEDVAKSDEFQQLAKDIAMHISWSNPDYMTREEVDQETLNKEREIHKQWAVKEGKPENIIDRIVEGRMKEFYTRACLLEQAYIKDEEQTIQGLITNLAKQKGEEISISKFVRFRVGETAVESE